MPLLFKKLLCMPLLFKKVCEHLHYACRLVTMAYGLHVAHLTTGMRIGSAAAEKQNLFAARALNFYRTYPDIQDPLKQFISTVNTAGGLLTAEQQEQVMDELPRAFPKISLLLTTLAHTN